MSGEDDGQDKSFDPTPRKLEQAREKGDVARSTDLHAAASYLGLIAAVIGVGALSAGGFAQAVLPFIASVDQLQGRILGPGGLWLSASLVGWAALAALPVFAIPALAVIASLVAQRAVVLAPDKLMPKLQRISPLATFKNKFGPTGLVEFLKSAVKMALIGAAVWFWLKSALPDLLRLAALPARGLARTLGDTLLSLLFVVAAITVAIGAVDYLWQRFDHARKLRMSLDEMRRENRETEGDPHLKGARRRRAEEIALNRMMLDVPKADVVIVNPTHYAVALKWSREKGSAPVCVAKGVDEVAAQIRAKAAEAGVPLHRDPPTARAIHATVEIGREIRPEHYRAVAAALRFSEEMRRKAASHRSRR